MQLDWDEQVDVYFSCGRKVISLSDKLYAELERLFGMMIGGRVCFSHDLH